MRHRHTVLEIDPTDLIVLGSFVHRQHVSGLPDDFIDETLEQARQGNGPAEFIVACWWEALSCAEQARYWYASSAGHNHPPALAKLQQCAIATRARKQPPKHTM